MHTSMLPTALYLVALLGIGILQMLFRYIFKVIRKAPDVKTLIQRAQSALLFVISLTIVLKFGLWDYIIACLVKSEWLDLTSFLSSSLSSPFHLTSSSTSGLRLAILSASLSLLGFSAFFQKPSTPHLPNTPES